MSCFVNEKDFENQIFDYILAKKENPCNGREVLGCARQLKLSEYGVADIVTLEKHGENLVINVIELKNVQFNSGMIFQIGRYIEAVKLGLNFKLLGNAYLDFDIDDSLILNENISVIGSLVCIGVRDLTEGEESVYSALKVTVYSFCLEMLSGYFDPVNSVRHCKSECVTELNSAIKSLISEI